MGPRVPRGRHVTRKQTELETGVSMQLSRHFRERWEERVGEPIPSPEEIEKLIRRQDTKWLQKCRDLYTSRGRKYRVLALYWIKERNMVIKIDEKNNVAVSVMSRGEAANE